VLDGGAVLNRGARGAANSGNANSAAPLHEETYMDTRNQLVGMGMENDGRISWERLKGLWRAARLKIQEGTIWIGRLRFVSSLFFLRCNIQHMIFTGTSGSSLPRTTPSYRPKPR